jgi:DinB superfamily
MCKTNRLRPADESAGDGAFAANLAALAAMPARFSEIVAAIAPTLWKTQAKDGGFSLQEHACHLRDIEIEAYRVRLERILAETTPVLADVDGAKLARERDYHRQDLRRAHAVFAAVRADLVHRLGSLSAVERERTGMLEGVGEISVDGLAAMMLAHDAEHLGELRLLRDELVH